MLAMRSASSTADERLDLILNQEWCSWLLGLPLAQFRWVLRHELEMFDAWNDGLITSRQIQDMAEREVADRF